MDNGTAHAFLNGEVEKETEPMKKTYLAIATLFLMTAGTVVASAESTPNPAPGAGQQQGKRNGKKLGKQDGSGPRHTPGTGGGTGAGTRRGRR